MKKLLLTALITSLLILPFGGTALAVPEEAAAPGGYLITAGDVVITQPVQNPGGQTAHLLQRLSFRFRYF